MCRSKVISSVVIVVDTKIAKSGNLGSCKHDSVELIEKLASVCLELRATAYKHHK